MLSISTRNAAGADEFLPCLIYVVIQANVPNLLANIEYVFVVCGCFLRLSCDRVVGRWLSGAQLKSRSSDTGLLFAGW